MNDTFYLGCHLSFSEGYAAMAKTAVRIGANVIQCFIRNPQGGKMRGPDPEDMAEFRTLARENGLAPLIIHAPYTVNPCSNKPEIREMARRFFIEELDRLEGIPGSLYNFHPGSHVKQGVEQGIEFIVDHLNAILPYAKSTTVLLETMAGKGSEIGATFEEIREIIDRTNGGDRLGVCLDTCHINDGGYNIVDNLDGVIDEFDRVIGLDRLRAIHLNDSKNPLVSHKDRHANIGEGTIGLDAIVRVINHPKLRNLPFCLETPQESIAGYEKEIKLLRSLRTPSP